jgi:hypothetical protein
MSIQMQIAKLAPMVTTRPINYQFTFISWLVLCFDVVSMKYNKCLECNHTFSCNSLDG